MISGLSKLFFVFLLAASVWRSAAQDFLEVGARGGASYHRNVDHFWQAETFVRIDLPSQWNFHSDWLLQTKLDASAGWLGDEGDNGFVGTLGPVLELHKGKFPLSVEVGFSPTILSRYRFDEKDFGERFQFTSHVALNWDITKHISAGYRFQHMSNGGFVEPNPGLNLQMLSVSYHF